MDAPKEYYSNELMVNGLIKRHELDKLNLRQLQLLYLIQLQERDVKHYSECVLTEAAREWRFAEVDLKEYAAEYRKAALTLKRLKYELWESGLHIYPKSEFDEYWYD